MSAIIHLFWTGGWDSTFRLLDLILIHNQTVQPFYVIDPERRSFPLEIKAIGEIKAAILERKPEAKELLFPTKFTRLGEIPLNERITEQYHRLLKVGHLGGQYEWLARFADWVNLHDLELCVQKGDFAFNFLERNVIKENDAKVDYFRLKTNFSNPNLALFKYFRFPIFNLRKEDIHSQAINNGFEDIMQLTWFCHRPLKNGLPCGNCTPCNEAIRDGFGRRLPLSSLIRWILLYKPRTSLKRWKRLLLAGEPKQ